MKIKTFIKTKRNRKWKIPQISLERQTMCFSSYKCRKFKERLRWVGARKRKKRAFFVPFFLSKRIFRTCILLHIKKHCFKHICCFFWKSSKDFSASLIKITTYKMLDINVLSNYKKALKKAIVKSTYFSMLRQKTWALLQIEIKAEIGHIP